MKDLGQENSKDLLVAIWQIINEVEQETEKEIRTKINDLFWSDSA